MSHEKDFSLSAWQARGKVTTIKFNAEVWCLLRWHYKHSLLNCWGSPELQRRLRPAQTLEEADEDSGVADMYGMGELNTPPSSSARKYC